MLKKVGIYEKIIVLGLLGAILLGIPPALNAEQTPPLNVDLAIYPIKDQKMREALGLEAIPIRAQSYSLPPMSLPLLKLKSISEKQINSQLNKISHQFLPGNFPTQSIKDLSDILVVKRSSKILWINKASGAYSFSETKGIMSRPTTILDHREAVDVALNFLVKQNLVALGPRETMDVEFVSQVMNAAVKDGENEPLTQYGSDYFVCFGRRYRGVPVVGSRLILRLGDNGKLFGVQKTWRPIEGEGEWVTINIPPMDQMQDFPPQDNGPTNQNITVLSTKSGYIEGPVKNKQLMMGPGSIVSYVTSPGSEMPSQKIIPSASVDFPLTGTRISFPPAKVKKQDLLPRKDRDDRNKEDELN
jgi:hypothetical protein